MMIDPKTYSQIIKGMSMSELREERNRLIGEIMEYEVEEEDDEIITVCNPNPETIYLHNHLYLAEVCRLIGERLSHCDLDDKV